MLKAESDFLAWTSFPSSVKLFNDDGVKGHWAILRLIQDLAVTPGKTLKVEVNAKQQGVASELASHSDLVISTLAKPEVWVASITLPFGTFDWRPLTTSKVVPTGVTVVRVRVSGGPGSPDKPGITWWDDLKIYQDDVLIYSNDFSNWNPVIGAGVGAVAVGATSYEATKRPEIAVPAALVGAGAGAGLGLFGPDAWSALIQGIAKEPLTTLAAGLAPVIVIGGAVAASELQKAHIFG